MKLDLAGKVNRLNVEHRTSNIERRIVMTLCFIYFKTSAPHLCDESSRISKAGSTLPGRFFGQRLG